MWMIKQARGQGGLPATAIDEERIIEEDLNIIEQPTVHDEVGEDPAGGVLPNFKPERTFRYLDEGEETDVEQADYETPYENDLDFAEAIGFVEDNIYQDSFEPLGNFVDDDKIKTQLAQTDNGETPYVQWLQANYGLIPDSPYGIAIGSEDGDE